MSAISDPGVRPGSSVAPWQAVLLCFAVVLLLCGLKNYLIYLVQGTDLCPVLCLAPFGSRGIDAPAALDALFRFHRSIVEEVVWYAQIYLDDEFKVVGTLFAAPVVEELIYRGPLFLLRKRSSKIVWWALAVILCIGFAWSHQRRGLLLLPVLALGMCSAWLISATQRFWPSLALHVLHNFYFLSIDFFRSAAWGMD